MMLTTHAVVGLLLALPVALLHPSTAPYVLAAGFLGGVLPDADVFGRHRRTLHYPVLYLVAAAPVAAAAALLSSVYLAASAVFLAAAGLHSVMDAFGGGLGLQPWRSDADRAVYLHVRRRWIPPLGGVRYDGSPEDLALAAFAAFPVIYLASGWPAYAAAAAVAVSAAYTLVRKPLARVVSRALDSLSPDVRRHVPGWLLESELEEGFDRRI